MSKRRLSDKRHDGRSSGFGPAAPDRKSEPPEVVRQRITSAGLQVPFDLLTAIRALRHIGNASMVRCYACDKTHEAAVEVAPQGQLRAYCPDAGFQEVLPHEVELYAIDLPVLVALIRRGLEMQTHRAPDEMVKGRLWWLGERRFGRIPRQHLFRPAGQRDSTLSTRLIERFEPAPGVLV